MYLEILSIFKQKLPNILIEKSLFSSKNIQISTKLAKFIAEIVKFQAKTAKYSTLKKM